MKFNVNLFSWKTYWAGLVITFLVIKGLVTVDLPGLMVDIRCSGNCGRK